MARRVKNNCEYFPHDAGMRNHRKVKAIRSKYSNGYAIWSMLIEYLTAADGNEFEFSDLEIQLMSGDFGFDPIEIMGVIQYCLTLELLFEKNGFVYSESLNEKLAPVYAKRGKAREVSNKQLRHNGKYCDSNAVLSGISVTEIPQIELNRIEVDEREEITPPSTNENIPNSGIKPYLNLSTLKGLVMQDSNFVEAFYRMGIKPDVLPRWLDAFHRKLEFDGTSLKQESDYRNHFKNWLKYQKYNTGVPEDCVLVEKPVIEPQKGSSVQIADPEAIKNKYAR